MILDDGLASAAADDWTGRVSECFSQVWMSDFYRFLGVLIQPLHPFQARSIIVVCSASYFRCVDPAAPQLDDAPQQLTDVHSQCSRFIYQLMCAEYRQYNCRNRRFRPIVFDDESRGVEIVPPILRNTVIHRWPSQHKDLMKLIFGDGQTPR